MGLVDARNSCRAIFCRFRSSSVREDWREDAYRHAADLLADVRRCWLCRRQIVLLRRPTPLAPGRLALLSLLN